MTDKETKDWVNLVVFYLAHPDRRDSEFDYFSLAEALGIAGHDQKTVFNALWNTSPKLINGRPSLKPLIKITNPGIEYADKLDADIYITTGQSVFDNPIDMTMPETCKFVFEKHIANRGTIAWLRETFRPNPPRNLYAAKDLLLHSGLIINSRTYFTIIAPPFLSATSYEDALRILKERDEKSKGNTTNVNVGRDMVHSPVIQDSRLEESPMTQSVNTTPNKKEAATTWYTSAIFIYLIWPLVVLLIGGFILYRLGWI